MLESLYKHHSELIKMASVFSKQYAEDIVQDAYKITPILNNRKVFHKR